MGFDVKMKLPNQMAVKMTVVFLLAIVVCRVLGERTTCDFLYDNVLEGLSADCSGRNFSSVPVNLPHNIVALNLRENFITTLLNEEFKNFTDLKSLMISNNKISVLEKDAFLGLTNLSYLDIRGNRLYLDNGSYPSAIFDPLVNLKSLFVEGDTRWGFFFPGYIFTPLSTLESLYIRGTWPEQGSDFSSLKSLQNLTIHTEMFVHIHNYTFSCLERVPLRRLTIRGVMNKIDGFAFCPLQNLTFLKLDSNYMSQITLQRVTKSFYCFAERDSVFEEIDLHNVQNTYIPYINTVVDRKVVGYLTDMCVETLDLSNNRIMVIKTDTFKLETDTFVKCIKHVNLSNNYIIFEVRFAFIISYFKNIISLNLSNNILKTFCSATCHLNKNQSVETLLHGNVSGIHVTLPPNLAYVNASRWGHNLSIRVGINVSKNNNLRVVDISNNGNLEIPAHINGMSNVTYLDISGMTIRKSALLNSDIFESLETLIAHDIRTFPRHLMLKDLFIFNLMPRLKKLDLSGNDIQSLEAGTFSRLTKVASLILSRNRLSHLPQELMRMPSLTFLDISFNSIDIIGKVERTLLEMKWERQGSFSLNIKGNDFVCICDTLDFVQWLHETPIDLGNKGDYSCLTEYGTTTTTTQFFSDLRYHWRRCVGQIWLTVAVSLLCFMTISMMSAFLLKKYFPRVEYHIFQALGYKGKQAPRRCDYTYDAYVCYQDKRYQWPCQSLFQELLKRDKYIRLYVPDLHEVPGMSKAEATIDAISKSFKVVIIVTEDLFEDEWSYFTVLTAIRLFSLDEVISSRILLVYQDISPRAKARVPQLLLNVVSEGNILEVTPGEDFWIRLRRMIIRENQCPEIVF